MNWLKQLFVRKHWKIVQEYGTYTQCGVRMVAVTYVMQDQFGNIKEKRISI